ncbi:hypothetical protein AGABI1DRAFT_103953 [Agaricus bisporus var. burnettii JB137-S8]|uniref:Uncharacterized protein n=1 Tax=Agaricus bisporus var. burnettii (strain JB137-S8 / ATCC MYA-4627 / FGSC 10392) TaxID=597362 RepID=K5XK45_AGABU|nr:uncharacterized protein AGABI1DRAFT_103953 [Agaricus bisporus var. burnettii JB137-S8]EKM83903.1 hypothetical protein AGABI1DRAFT_103953 [Agaricus bisporus var. burnettii JB137-S8]
MTITSSPQTTLSFPSSIAVTNPKNGDVVLSAPSLITVLSTWTESDGAFVTHTQLVANPPPIPVDGETSTGFLERHGQVAGVFTVVGVFAAAFVFALIWFIRRHRRRQRRKEWFASLRQYPPSPFAQASPDSQMRSIHTTTETTHDPHMVNYDNFGYRPRSLLVSTAEESTGLGLTNAGNAQTGVLVPLRRPLSGEDPFRDPPHVPRNTPVSFSPNHDRLNESSGVSIAPSSPSIYPESLPPTVDTPSPVDPEPKTQAKYFSETLLRRSLSVTSHTDAPPRPPRSYLRESQKVNDVSPLTPPASVSSHGHSDLEPQFIFHPMRRNTLHTRREESHKGRPENGSDIAFATHI